MKSTDLVINMLKTAKKYSHSAHYVLFDTWFCFPDSLIKIKKLGYDVISMAKKTPKQLYCHKHQMLPLKDIYKKCKKHPGKSGYMLSVVVQVTKGTEHTTAKVVYIRNRNTKAVGQIYRYIAYRIFQWVKKVCLKQKNSIIKSSQLLNFQGAEGYFYMRSLRSYLIFFILILCVFHS